MWNIREWVDVKLGFAHAEMSRHLKKKKKHFFGFYSRSFGEVLRGMRHLGEALDCQARQASPTCCSITSQKWQEWRRLSSFWFLALGLYAFTQRRLHYLRGAFTRPRLPILRTQLVDCNDLPAVPVLRPRWPLVALSRSSLEPNSSGRWAEPSPGQSRRRRLTWPPCSPPLIFSSHLRLLADDGSEQPQTDLQVETLGLQVSVYSLFKIHRFIVSSMQTEGPKVKRLQWVPNLART